MTAGRTAGWPAAPRSPARRGAAASPVAAPAAGHPDRRAACCPGRCSQRSAPMSCARRWPGWSPHGMTPALAGPWPHRDPAGFARLAGLCDRAAAAWPGRPQPTLHRAAVIMAAKGGHARPASPSATCWSCWTPRRSLGAVQADGRCLLPDAAPDGDLRARRAEAAAGAAHRGQRTPDELIDRYRPGLPALRDLLVDYLKERQPAMDYSSLGSLPARPAGSGQTWKATTPASPACTCPHRWPSLEAAPADQGRRPSRPARRRKTAIDPSGSATASA